MDSGRLLIISTTAAVLFLVLLAYLFATEPQRLDRSRQKHEGGQIEIGADLYQHNCRTCHGSRGEGVGQLGPPLSDEHFFTKRLAEVGWQATLAEYIVSTTEHGRMMGTRPIYAGNGSTAVMSPWHRDYGGPLRSDEIAALTAFMLNWERTALGDVELTALELPKTSAQDPAVVERGREVFRDKCSRCHRYGGIDVTEVPGPDLTAIAAVIPERKPGVDSLDYLRESILVPRAVVAEQYREIAAEHDCGATLTESELTAVTALLMQ